LRIEKLRSFAKSFPSIRLLKKYIEKIDINNVNRFLDVSSIYIAIEVLNLYYKRFDSPLYKVNLFILNVIFYFQESYQIM